MKKFSLLQLRRIALQSKRAQMRQVLHDALLEINHNYQDSINKANLSALSKRSRLGILVIFDGNIVTFNSYSNPTKSEKSKLRWKHPWFTIVQLNKIKNLKLFESENSSKEKIAVFTYVTPHPVPERQLQL